MAALLAYPRLYAAWALWGLSIRALVREIAPTLSGRCYHAHTQEAVWHFHVVSSSGE
jgi:hypothetical protein